MSLKYALTENLLTERKDDYMAQTQQVRSYNIEDVAERMLKRGSLLTKADILAVLEVYHTEIADLIAEGDAVNTPIFHISPSIAGVFEDASDTYDHNRHKVRINLNAGVLLREAQKHIKPEKVEGGETQAHIVQVVDIKSGTTNDLLTPNRNLRIKGHRVKISGEQPTVGVYFIDAKDSNQRTKVDASDIVTNNPSDLVVVIPELPKGSYKLELCTQFSGGGKDLKDARTSIFNKILIVQ
ncbi:MAG: DNA-binding domain-containing protein [Bacteroidales bacterium]